MAGSTSPVGCFLQVGAGFNRDYWARFEKFVKDTVKISDGVFVVTGPLWLPQPDGRGTGKWEMRHPMIGKLLWLIVVSDTWRVECIISCRLCLHGVKMVHEALMGFPCQWAGRVLLAFRMAEIAVTMILTNQASRLVKHFSCIDRLLLPLLLLQASPLSLCQCPLTTTRWCWQRTAAGSMAAIKQQ